MSNNSFIGQTSRNVISYTVKENNISLSGNKIFGEYNTPNEPNSQSEVVDISLSTGNTIVGSAQTITVNWKKNSASAIDSNTKIDIYRSDDNRGKNLTFITGITATSHVISNSNNVESKFNYVFKSNNVGYRLIYRFIPILSGVVNLTGNTKYSPYTSVVVTDINNPNEYSGFTHVAVSSGFTSANGNWVDVGSEKGAWLYQGTGATPTEDGAGFVNNNHEAGWQKTNVPTGSGDWTVAIKFILSGITNLDTLAELGNDRIVNLTTSGAVEVKSTTSDVTTGTLTTGVSYNLIVIHSGNTASVRCEEDDSSLVFDELLSGVGTSGIASPIAVFQDYQTTTDVIDGGVKEWAIKNGTIDDTQKSNILTRLKSL